MSEGHPSPALSHNEKLLLQALAQQASGDAEELARAAATDPKHGVSALSWLATKGLVEVSEEVTPIFSLEEEGRHHARHGLPERRALERLRSGEFTLQEGVKEGVFSDLKEGQIAIGWLRRKGWAKPHKTESGLYLQPAADLKQHLARGPGADEQLLKLLEERGELTRGDIEELAGGATALKDLRSRKGLIRERTRTLRSYQLTTEGRALVDLGLDLTPRISQLTHELLLSGAWREAEFAPYDVATHAAVPESGGRHPLSRLIQQIRLIFLEMGFSEIGGDFVESAFWNMDTLFIPQDHPARELQDTLYLSRPETIELTDEEFIKKIKAIQEHGGDTGSRGWGGAWDPEVGKRPLLRTHTTVNTVRHLQEHPEPPVKVFSVGRVFRRENVDSTHLPEFHQIEGICMEQGASFAMLVGLLKHFYARMGFPQVRARPGYFPYTEPSLEVEVLWQGRWLELGGAGIFRPEVTAPFGVEHPVLAWGLGLERLAMLRLGLDDIRQLYLPDLQWLREARL